MYLLMAMHYRNVPLLRQEQTKLSNLVLQANPHDDLTLTFRITAGVNLGKNEV